MNVRNLNFGRPSSFAVLMSATILLVLMTATAASADPVVFNSGDVDGLMAVASRPSSVGKSGIEAGDDFVIGSTTAIKPLTVTGLLTGGATVADISQVVTDFYRVFPRDSNTARALSVPTRVNSPADVEFADRNSAASGLSFTATRLQQSFATNNSVGRPVKYVCELTKWTAKALWQSRSWLP